MKKLMLVVSELRRRNDEVLEALLGALDVIDAASSTLTETENRIYELACESMNKDPNEHVLAELGDETRTVDLRLALGVVNAWLTKRNDLSTWLSDSDLSEVNPDGLRAALG
jgi:hypothetical protein